MFSVGDLVHIPQGVTMIRQLGNNLRYITTTRPDGVMAVQYDKLIPILINAIQELEARVKTLEG